MVSRDALGTVRRVLEACPGRRLRPLLVGLSNTGLAAHPAGPSLDCRAPARLDAFDLGLGNLLGGLAGYYRNSRILKAFGVLSMGIHPIPYYVAAFVLLIIFGFLWPVLPISGGATMASDCSDTFAFGLDVVVHSILPVLSLMAVGIGGWFMGMRSLVSNIVTEDYVVYAELAGVKRGKILRSYVMRNALGPQVTGLALQLGAIFNGAIITEQVFGYPGVGSLLISAVHAGDYSLVLGITTVSIVAVSAAVLLIDLLYPLIDPRVEAR